MSSPAQEAAAGLIADVMNEGPAVTEDLAGVHPPQLAVAGDLYPRTPEQPTPQDAEPTPEPAPAAEPALPAWEADLDGLGDLLDGPDFDDDEDDDEQLAPAAESLEPNEYDDPEVAKLKAKYAKLEKKLQYEQQLRAKSSLKEWRAEASRRFPLADTNEIEASSRRAFMRKALEQHNRYAAKLKPFTDVLDGLKQQAVAEVKQQARTEAEQAWGKPVTGVSVPQVAESDDSAQFDPRRYKNPHDLIKAKLRAGKYGPI